MGHGKRVEQSAFSEPKLEDVRLLFREDAVFFYYFEASRGLTRCSLIYFYIFIQLIVFVYLFTCLVTRILPLLVLIRVV